MIAGLCAAAELTDDHRLVVGNLPRHLRGIVHVAIPTDILVEAHHVDIFVHVVLQTVVVVGRTRHLHRHRDEACGVLRAGIGGQTSEELVALGRVRRLVGNTPDDDIRTVMVAGNHVLQLCLSILIGGEVLPGDGPIDGNLRPHQNTHALSFAHSIFVVRIVGQTHEVATQLLRPREQRVGISRAVGATAAVGFLLVYADTLQEDGLTVEQNLLAARLNLAETHLVGQRLAVHRDFHLIQFRCSRAPEHRLCLHVGRRRTVAARREHLVDFQFRNVQRHLLAGLGLVQLHGEAQTATLEAEQLQRVVLHIGGRNIDEQHVARDAAIVPPVEDLRGHILGVALVVDLHDDEVLAILQLIGDIEVERCEAADVVAHMFAVHIDVRIVVHCSEIQQRAARWVGGWPLELLVEPHRSLIEEQAFVACVPVGRNGHLLGLVEVVFDEVFRLLRLLVAEESPARGVHAIVVVAFLLHIDDVVPRAVERRGLSSEDVAYLRHLLCQRGE